MKHEFTNELIHETSPYLLQHAHNPVDWMPWGDAAIAKAKAENKPMLISIGYSACHWCHVMEHESFEDTAVANLMNQHFVCIKVDREERPDVDQVYMDAVQLMTGSGGWPLNCFAMPDGRPFFGGTYFPKDKWMQVLSQISDVFQNEQEKVIEYAEKLTAGLTQMDQMPLVEIPKEFSAEILETAVARWKQSLDYKEGGADHSPKFPMPNNLQFQLAWAVTTSDKELLSYVHLTLRKMAFGGIYDQVGGGFARYSTDANWKVPHFEKMLYDNGQLLSIYSQTYLQNGDKLYLDIINQTAEWIEREMTSKEGAFFSALDADSEGEEGKFYVWKKEELAAIAQGDFALIEDYYNINNLGLWEHGNYILLRDKPDVEIAKKNGISLEELHLKTASFNEKALIKREERIRPGLDDKCLTSWNALASKGLVDAYIATGKKRWLELAKTNLDFLMKTQVQKDGQLWHSFKNGRSTINGYLEDYAHLIDALLHYYEATLDEAYLQHVKVLTESVFKNFDQNENGFFYFKSMNDPELVAKKTEITDNVMPASNSVFATCCFKLGLLLADKDLLAISTKMLAHVESNFVNYPSGYSQWMLLHQMNSQPYYEIAIVGDDCLKKLEAMSKHYISNAVFCGGKNEENLPILEHKLVDGKTFIYVCQNGACQLPTEDVDKALGLLR